MNMNSIKIILLLLSLVPIVGEVESNNNSSAIGDNGNSIGFLQIQKICVEDVNRIYGTFYTHSEMMDKQKSTEVFLLYLSYGIKLYYKKYKRYPTNKEIIRMWNGGIYTGHRKNSTLKYYKKFKKYDI